MAACDANLVDENNTNKASALVDEIIYISDDEVEYLTLDTVKGMKPEWMKQSSIKEKMLIMKRYHH